MEIVKILPFLLLHYTNSVYCNDDQEFKNPPGCGIPVSNEIFEGKNVRGYPYPWFVFLMQPSTNKIACAGTLISAYHVLTAAHCFNSLRNLSAEVQHGVAITVYNRCNDWEVSRLYIPVVKVFIHEKYMPYGQSFDIALVRLGDSPIDATPICLPHPGNTLLAEPATLIGFAVTDERNVNVSCNMREANITKFTRWQCMEKLKTVLPPKALGPDVFCAGNEYEKPASCIGDLGGPLMTRTRHGRYVLAGIASDSYKCGNGGVSGIYTDVATYVPWIYKKMNNTSLPDGLTREVVLAHDHPEFMRTQDRERVLNNDLSPLRRPLSLTLVKFFTNNYWFLRQSPKRKRIPKLKPKTKHICRKPCRCGKPQNTYHTVIVNGEEVPPHHYPWIVLLTKQHKLGIYLPMCGGSLISDEYVLTAAHCFNNYLHKIGKAIRITRVHLGEHNISNAKDSLRQIHNVIKIIIHKGFSMKTRENDIALVKLDKRITFKEGISTICLPKPNAKIEGDFGTVAGWGKTEKATGSKILKQTNVKLLRNEKCRTDKGAISEKRICTGNGKGHNACHGDSGGSLMLANKNRQVVVIGKNESYKTSLTSFATGILSTGIGDCHSKDLRITFTKVAPYLDWIIRNTQDSCYCK